MTEPLNPNRVGGVRGANGTTLDELKSKAQEQKELLSELNTKLGETNTILSGLATQFGTLLERVTFISGTEDPSNLWDWQGIGSYLPAMFGDPFTANDFPLANGRYLGVFLRDFPILMRQLVNALGETDVPGANGEPKYIREIHSELLRIAPFIAQPGENTDSSIFDLLQSLDTNVADIEACVCNGNGGNNPFPAPDFNCLGQSVVYQPVTLQYQVTLSGPNPVDVYNVVFPSSTQGRSDVGNEAIAFPEANGWVLNLLTDVTAPPLRTTGFTACFAWNLDPANLPVVWNIQNNAVANSPNASTTPFGNTPAQGGQLVEVDSMSSGAVLKGAQWIVGFPQGVTPSGGFYVTVLPLNPT